MESLCGLDCCSRCGEKDQCGGCGKTGGHPFGGVCVAARWAKEGGLEELRRREKALVDEINALGIPDLNIDGLNLLRGVYMNLEYQLPNGRKVKFLEDRNVYWGTQVEIPGSGECYGVAGDDGYLLVCRYGCDGADPRIVLYKRR